MWLSAAHLVYLLTQFFVDFAALPLVFLLISRWISWSPLVEQGPSLLIALTMLGMLAMPSLCESSPVLLACFGGQLKKSAIISALRMSAKNCSLLHLLLYSNERPLCYYEMKTVAMCACRNMFNARESAI